MRKGRFLFVLGFAAVALLAVPCLLLGERAVFTYHDQLDGEMIAYILQAKHLWDGSFLPEFLGGADKTALTPPAPGCVLLFRVCSPLTALIIMQLAGSLTGYVGMYLLTKKTTGSDAAALIAGGFYAALPFLPVYGLSQYGLPLLLWFVLRVRETASKETVSKEARKEGADGETEGRKILLGSAAYAAFYALHSSLVLVGFAVLAVLAVWILLEKKSRLRMGAVWLVILSVYLLTNLSLIGQMLGLGDAAVSHKTEYVLAPEGFLAGWRSGFLYGGQHSEDYHLGFLWLVAAVLLFMGIRRYREPDRAVWEARNQTGLLRVMVAALGCNVCLAGVSACWNSGAGVALRRHLGAPGAFQLDRLLWLSPCLWYLLLGCAVAAVLRLSREKKRALRAAGLLGCTLAAAALCVTGFQIVKNSDVKANLQKLRHGEYDAMSYSDYYALGVLDQVQDFLREYTGQEPASYRVVSLGIDPAAALYHGFYCLDGYSNNYSLEYKHRFRRVIAPALSESAYLRAYFDEWGNRCYLFGTECPGYYTIEKDGFYFQHLEMDTEALRDLRGDYLLSAAYIANSEELGLTLLSEEPFETEESYYRIFLYALQ